MCVINIKCYFFFQTIINTTNNGYEWHDENRYYNNETITLITKILVYLLDVLPLVAIGYSTC